MGDATFLWKADQVIELITARAALNKLFTRKKGSSRKGYDMVAAQLRFGASSAQCKKKFENLQTKYKTIIIPPTGQGLEEQPHAAQDWPFYDDMHKFMSSRHTINPLLVLQSYSPIESHPTSGTNKTIENQRVRSPPSSTCTSLAMEDSISMEIEPPQPPASGSSQFSEAPSYSSSSSTPSTSSTLLTKQQSTCRKTYLVSPPQTSSSDSSSSTPSTSSTLLTIEKSPCRKTYSVKPLQASPTSNSSFSSSGSCSSWESNHDDEIDEPIVQARRKRRRTVSSNNSISELIALVREDLGNQERQREKARKVEEDLLDVLREFLSKK